MLHGEEYSRWQIAQEYEIPLSQVDTINLDKVAAYKAYLKLPEQELITWMDTYTLYLLDLAVAEDGRDRRTLAAA
jgi:hypothetical protein